MMASDPAVFIPGFEPLDYAGLTAAQKTAFMEAVYTFPPDEARFAGWRKEILRGKRVNRQQIESFKQLSGKTVAGFKMRPYTLDGNVDDYGTGNNSFGSRMHTGASGLRTAALRELLNRYNVKVVVTLRRNRLKEALSWYKAWELGISQFKVRSRAGGGAPAATALAVGGQVGTSAGDEQHVLGQTAQLGTGDRLHINTTKVKAWLRYTDAVNAALHRAVTTLGRPTHTVWYEDFLSDPLAEAQQAAAFMGAPQAGRRVRLASKFVKAGPDAIQEWVANYQDLCDALHGTVYYEHLDPGPCTSPSQAASSGWHQQGRDGDGLKRLSAASTEGKFREDTYGNDLANIKATLGVPFSSERSVGGDTAGSASTGSRTAVDVPSSSSAVTFQPGRLLTNWCAPMDKEASGWSELTDQDCMQRYKGVREAAVAAVRRGEGTLLFKHVHKAGGSTLCKLANRNMVAESAPLPLKKDWDTNCVPYEAFLGPHPAVGSSTSTALSNAGEGNSEAAGHHGISSNSGSSHTRSLQARHWLGGACWLGFLTQVQQRALPHHFRPLTFVASEGPLPDSVALDAPLAWVTMLRRPLDRVLSSYRWWQFMVEQMPLAPAECRAYSAPPNATLEQWLAEVPDNWMTRELVGRSALYQRSQLTEADLLVAKQRLHYFAAVLLLEQPGTSMALMQRLFGWNDAGWQEARAGSRRGSNATAELDLRLLQHMQKLNQFDMRLYAYAVTLHAAQIRQAGLE